MMARCCRLFFLWVICFQQEPSTRIPRQHNKCHGSRQWWQTCSGNADKAIARSWVVNYVESGNSARGEEMLRLMAEWWEFTEADLQRVGLSDAPHPDREYRTGLSWSDAFAAFLDEQAKAEDPLARPAPRSPTTRWRNPAPRSGSI